jgi:hypothetical protein
VAALIVFAGAALAAWMLRDDSAGATVAAGRGEPVPAAA